MVQILYRSYNTFLSTWCKAATNVPSIPKFIHCETHSHWVYQPWPIEKKPFIDKKTSRNSFQNWMSFQKAVNLYKKKLKEFSTRPNFFYKLFLYNYFIKIRFIAPDIPLEGVQFFSTKRFPKNKLSIKIRFFLNTFFRLINSNITDLSVPPPFFNQIWH